ncbi:MAG: hypothetical protein LLG14_10205 [Nocardiaceae bacterium]|nr:hypothetical protein [Nocardiaceae bacterium]
MSFVTALIRVNYRVVRTPADLVRRKVLNRLPDDSLVRLTADGAIGLADAVIGRITGDDELRERGGAMAKSVTDVLATKAPRLNIPPLERALTPPAYDAESLRTEIPGGLEIDGYTST